MLRLSGAKIVNLFGKVANCLFGGICARLQLQRLSRPSPQLNILLTAARARICADQLELSTLSTQSATTSTHSLALQGCRA